MIIDSLQYLIFFSAALFITITLRLRQNQIAFLILASLVFYFLSSGYLIVCLIFVSLVTYYCGMAICREINPWRRRFYLALASICALGQLAIFKYSGLMLGFFGPWVSSLNQGAVLDASGWMLPLGISFYTFQSLSYVFDIYRGQLKADGSLKDYILFVAFFPQITSGPIVRARDFLGQMVSMPGIGVKASDLKYGITLIGLGLFKKMVLADNLAWFANPIFSSPTDYGSLRIILATVTFGVQLYCDFSGYSDIVVGSVRIMGLKYPINFNNPYLALNPSDFWRRWHISLSSFLRDYLYIPLGGNRAGHSRAYLNLLITMAICGLWHGSSWNFLLWGIYHGVLLSAYKLLFQDLSLFTRLGAISGMKLWIAIKVLATQYFVFLGWLIFRITNWNDLVYCLDKFIFLDFISRLQYSGLAHGFIKESAAFIILFVLYVAMITSYRDEFCCKDWVGLLSSLDLKYWLIYLMVVIFALIWFAPSSSINYIYSAF
jgi:alginate O-acetyltransferase complex protein AlgI